MSLKLARKSFSKYFYILLLLIITLFLALPLDAKTTAYAFKAVSKTTANSKTASSKTLSAQTQSSTNQTSSVNSKNSLSSSYNNNLSSFISSYVNNSSGSTYTSSVISSYYNKSINNTYLSSSTSGSAISSSKVNSPSSSKTHSSVVSSKKVTSSRSSVSNHIPNVQLSTNKLIIGYYGGWSAYNGYTPDKINASHLNYINYSFAVIGSDLKITVEDSTIDYSNFDKLNQLKAKYNGLKTNIAIGGWDGSQNFSAAAATPSSRQVFAQSCIDFIQKYGFDGINLDWEYPASGGKLGNITSPSDKTNFTALLQELRTQLDALGDTNGNHYSLSIAGGASYGYLNNIEPTKIANYIDYAVVMAYDIHGNWDSYSDFNAPLYSPQISSPQYVWSDDASIKAWSSRGFPASKLLLGVPFYGYVYSVTSSQNNGLFQPFSACKTAGYDTIMSKYYPDAAFAKLYQPQAMVPYLFNGNTFISYDDESSLALKAKFALSNGLYGVSAWELSFDRSGVLLNAMYEAMK